MNHMQRIKLTLLSLSALVLIVAGCGGSGGSGSGSSASGTAAALKVADRVSVVDAQEDGGGVDGASSSAQVNNSGSFVQAVGALSIGSDALPDLGTLSVSDLPSSSDYHQDPSSTYVEERSAEAFGIINEILCYMGQTRYDLMLNKGEYQAQIDVGQCEQERDDVASAGQDSQNQSSGSNMTEYDLWTVNSSRADSNSPHIVQVWFDEEGEAGGPDGHEEPAQTFEVKVAIIEGVSEKNPFGLFTLDFKASSPDSGKTLMTGYLKSEVDSTSGDVLLKFYSDGHFGQEKVTLKRSSEGTSGAGSTYTVYDDPRGTERSSYDIAYNDSYFFRSDGDKEVCLDRKNPDVSAWRYGMYNDENHRNPGKRVTVNSGFPIKYKKYYGWAGYHGIWLPDDASVSNGDTVYKQEYDGNGSSETPYTVFVARGKLIKHTKKSLTLGEIANIPLQWHTCTNLGCSEYRLEWDRSNEKLYKTAEMDTNTWVWQDINPPEQVVFDLQAWDFNFYSDSLGGSGRVNLKDPTDPTGAAQITLTNTTPLFFHLQETVYPGDRGVPANLACFENCLDPSSINTDNPYFAKSTWETPGNNDELNQGVVLSNYGELIQRVVLSNYAELNQGVAPNALAAETNYVPYTFDDATMELNYTNGHATNSDNATMVLNDTNGQATPVVMTNNSNNEHGSWSGALIEPTEDNLALLACDWNNHGTCVWQVWDKLDVFYTWETGTQQWNRLTALQDGNSFISFDPPLSVEYTHRWSDSGTSKFYLEYNGFGDMHGIPGKCVDMDTGRETDCWDEGSEKYIRWVPEFTIPDKTSVTDAARGGKYYVKALEKEERMRSVSKSRCTESGLEIEVYELPDGSDYADPDLGRQPNVDEAPAVIGGILQ